jgi:hypothetical protein
MSVLTRFAEFEREPTRGIRSPYAEMQKIYWKMNLLSHVLSTVRNLQMPCSQLFRIIIRGFRKLFVIAFAMIEILAVESPITMTLTKLNHKLVRNGFKSFKVGWKRINNSRDVSRWDSLSQYRRLEITDGHEGTRGSKSLEHWNQL